MQRWWRDLPSNPNGTWFCTILARVQRRVERWRYNFYHPAACTSNHLLFIHTTKSMIARDEISGCTFHTCNLLPWRLWFFCSSMAPSSSILNTLLSRNLIVWSKLCSCFSCFSLSFVCPFEFSLVFCQWHNLWALRNVRCSFNLSVRGEIDRYCNVCSSVEVYLFHIFWLILKLQGLFEFLCLCRRSRAWGRFVILHLPAQVRRLQACLRHKEAYGGDYIDVGVHLSHC